MEKRLVEEIWYDRRRVFGADLGVGVDEPRVGVVPVWLVAARRMSTVEY